MELENAILIGRQTTAQVLSVSVRLLDLLVKEGRLRPRRIGKRVLFLKSEILEFAREGHEFSGTREAEDE